MKAIKARDWSKQGQQLFSKTPTTCPLLQTCDMVACFGQLSFSILRSLLINSLDFCEVAVAKRSHFLVYLGFRFLFDGNFNPMWQFWLNSIRAVCLWPMVQRMYQPQQPQLPLHLSFHSTFGG